MGVPVVDLAAVRRAAEVLDGVAVRTPVERSRALSELVGGEVWLKCENLQRAGSFKLRGAYVRLAGLGPDERALGVVAASAGNHAQGVALAARELGIAATVFMPRDAALPKVAATRDYGAEVVLAGGSVDEALAEAHAFADESGAVLIHPFDHPDVVAGQGTVALEILEQVPDVATVVVPVGGGGLAAGIAAVCAARAEPVRVVGVQSERAAAFPASLRAGAPVAVPVRPTMADGIAISRPGAVPLDVLAAAGAEFCTVTEEEISQALLLVAERAKLVVEPAGAAGVAALLGAPQEFAGPVVVVLSGGNIDPLVPLRVLRHGLAAAGRYQLLRIRVPDTPGALAGLLADVAAVGGNVMHVSHVRTGPGLALGEVEVDLQVETKGPEHCTQLVSHLQGHGYAVRAD